MVLRLLCPPIQGHFLKGMNKNRGEEITGFEACFQSWELMPTVVASLGVNLTVSGKNHHPEMGITPVIQTLGQEGTPLAWTTPSSGNLYKDSGGRKGSLVLCLLASLYQQSIPLLALAPTSLGFQHIQRTS